jgi:predicted MFS family arabinose efflux permease
MNALIPSLVEVRDLDQAIALNSATFTVARAVGPALAGIVVASLGAAAAFGLNSLTFLPLILVLAIIRPREVVRHPGDRSVRAGITYLRNQPSMMWLIIATLAVGWSVDPANTLTPAYAEMFGRGESFVGFQVAAFGAGSAISSLLVSRLRGIFSLVSMTRVGLLLLATGLGGVALSPNEVALLLFWFVTGVGFLFGITTTNSNLQQRLDENMRGRIMALWGMAFLGSRPLAGLIDGGVADLTSPRIGVAAAIVPLVVGWYALGRVERADQPADHSA